MLPDSKRPIRVVVADDHPIFRLGVRALLAAEPGMELVAEAHDGEHTLRLVGEHQPDVLLLDYNLPRLNGLQVLRQLPKDSPVRTVIVTASIDAGEARQLLLQGARGVLLKHTASEMLCDCIRKVAQGEYWVGAEEVSTLIDALRSGPVRESTTPLTARELEIVAGVVHAESNKEIAARLNIGEQTVKNHLRSIFEKLKVANRVELALKAVEDRLVPSGD